MVFVRSLVGKKQIWAATAPVPDFGKDRQTDRQTCRQTEREETTFVS